VSETKHSIWSRLYRGETSFDFVGHRRRWFILSGTIILIGVASLLFRGLNFSIDFKGGTVWEVPSSASVSHVRDVIGNVSPDLRQATIQVLTNRQTGEKTVRVAATSKESNDRTKVNSVSEALAKMAGVDVNKVTLNDVGPSWGHDITTKAIRALIIFMIAVVIYITFRFEGKMAIAALIALVHDILVTAGIYSLSGLQVSPATVIAFLTILGYSLYDTIVVFDKIEENTKGLASTGRLTYTDTVNLSMNQVLMRSINTSIVAIMPILSILIVGSLVLGASALQDFGLALFIGLLTGAYSSIFIASPVLAMLKEREPRYSQIRQRLATRAALAGPLTPAAVASGAVLLPGAGAGAGGGRKARPAGKATAGRPARPSAATAQLADDGDEGEDEGPQPATAAVTADGGGGNGAGRPAPRRQQPGRPATRSGNRPPPRPRKKGRRR
jgi:preprotein translocase subunit SecF